MSAVTQDLSKPQKPKKSDFDVMRRIEPPLVKHALLHAEDYGHVIRDFFSGRFTRQALRSINSASEHIKSALTDFDRHPDYRIGITLPESRSYLLGAMINVMKTCGVPRHKIKNTLDNFKRSDQFTSDELDQSVRSQLAGQIPGTKDGEALRVILDCTMQLTRVMKDKYKTSADLKSVIDNVRLVDTRLASLSENLY